MTSTRVCDLVEILRNRGKPVVRKKSLENAQKDFACLPQIRFYFEFSGAINSIPVCR